MKYKAAIFDLDGTLLDTIKDLYNSTNYALAINNMPERSLDEVRCFVGNGVRKLIERAIPNGAQNPLFDKVFNDFKNHYSIHCKDTTKPYDGIIDVLNILKNSNIKTAIVSNKLDSAVKALNEEYFGSLIPVAIGETDNIRKKPAPDTVIEALRLIGCRENEAVYIGDSEVDVETASNCNMDCISVTWGFRDIKTLIKAGATVFANNTKELLDEIM